MDFERVNQRGRLVVENDEDMKKCPSCGELKMRYDFKGQGFCPPCKKAYNKRYRLMREWGLSWDQYLEMSKDGCQICGCSESEAGERGFAVDHCHDTGRIRGVLCQNCNRGIGLLGDDPVRLEKAVRYLHKFT